MNIIELDTRPGLKRATVTFDYDELRCINNSLYSLSETDAEKDPNFNEVRAKIIELFALVKHGHIPQFELEIMHRLRCCSKKSEENE